MPDRMIGEPRARSSRTASPSIVRGVCGGFRLFGGPGLLLRKTARNAGGAAAVEFAVTAPVLVALVVVGADYSTMANKQGVLEAATRAGAEYGRAKYAPEAQNNWNNTKRYVTNYTNFSPAVTVSASTVCTCVDGTTTACPGAAFCNAHQAADPRVLQYVSITATQNFSALLAWSAFGFPATLSATTVARFQ